tara:strand:- start:115 stop:798 length:684 start_codon:yes stop_codon:yes gene_type:complete
MLILGHRGAPSIKPENTLASFEAALAHNVDGIELDIQLTSDGQIIVYHDFEILDTNNTAHLISSLSLNEIQSVSPTLKIPTLQDVCEMFPRTKIFNIEIKSQALDNADIIQKTLSLIEKYNFIDNVIVSSFNPFVLLNIKKKAPNIKRGLLWTGNNSEGWFVTHSTYSQIKPYSFHANIEYLDSNLAQWALQHDLQIFVYTVNTKPDLEKAYKLNVHGIFTDFPTLT